MTNVLLTSSNVRVVVAEDIDIVVEVDDQSLVVKSLNNNDQTPEFIDRLESVSKEAIENLHLNINNDNCLEYELDTFSIGTEISRLLTQHCVGLF